MSADTSARERAYITDPPAAAPAAPLDTPEERPGLSLADRVKARRDALETEQTTTVDLPGFEGILAVELRLIAWTTGRRIGARHREQEDEALQVLYTSADAILEAQEQFYEVHPGEDEELVALTETWNTLCVKAGKRLPDDASERVAMIALLDDVGVMSLFGEYEAWRLNRGRKVAEAVVRDFGKTR